LPGKEPGSYLIEEYTLASVPVPQLISELVREEGRKQLQKKLLVLGNVDYNAAFEKPKPERTEPETRTGPGRPDRQQRGRHAEPAAVTPTAVRKRQGRC